MEIVDVAIAGAGLCGAAIAHELVRRGFRVIVLEAESEAAAGASRSNSGVLHTGFDSTPGTLETQLIRRQAELWPQLFDELRIPHRRCGALLLARSISDVERFPSIAATAAENGVRVRAITRKELRRLETYAEGVAAIDVPHESITDPYEVVRRLLASARVHFDARVTNVEPIAGGALVHVGETLLRANVVINAAGLFGDELAADGTFQIIPRRGEFVAYASNEHAPLSRILLPMPTERTKGVLVFPTLYGNICAGPSAVDQDDKNDWCPREAELRAVQDAAAQMFPPLRALPRVDAWAGLRPSGAPRNYIIEWSPRVPWMLNVGAIRSTGLSACLGIAEYVAAQIAQRDVAPRGPVFAVPALAEEAAVPWWQRLNTLRDVRGTC